MDFLIWKSALTLFKLLHFGGMACMDVLRLILLTIADLGKTIEDKVTDSSDPSASTVKAFSDVYSRVTVCSAAGNSYTAIPTALMNSPL